MPTVARSGNLRAFVYPNDHRPAHVHIQGLATACDDPLDDLELGKNFVDQIDALASPDDAWGKVVVGSREIGPLLLRLVGGQRVLPAMPLGRERIAQRTAENRALRQALPDSFSSAQEMKPTPNRVLSASVISWRMAATFAQPEPTRPNPPALVTAAASRQPIPSAQAGSDA